MFKDFDRIFSSQNSLSLCQKSNNTSTHFSSLEHESISFLPEAVNKHDHSYQIETISSVSSNLNFENSE
jgi:hypothetical protein